MDFAQMNDDQHRAHFTALAHQYANRYAQIVVDALGGTVAADVAAVLYRIGFELGHDDCQVLARAIHSRTAPATPEGLDPSFSGQDARLHATTYTFTVLHLADAKPADMGVALVEAEHGNAVGAVTNERTVAVDDADIAERLRELGNDGTFFDSELGRE